MNKQNLGKLPCTFHWIETYNSRFWVCNNSKLQFRVGFKTYHDACQYIEKLHTNHKRII